MTTSIPVPAGAGGQPVTPPDATVGTALPGDAPPRARTREFAERPPSWFQIIWSSGKARIGVFILGFFVLMAVFAPLIAPYDPQDGSFAPLLSPSWTHLMGTTSQGYDIFSQFVFGTRLSLLVGIFGGLFATVIAVFVGMISGYAEGTLLDNVLSFFTNLALVVPVLPLMMVIIAYSEVRGLWLMVFVIGITSWAGAARAKRSQIITLRSREFVTAAKFSGEKSMPIVFREIMPNMTSLVVSGFIAAATGAIVAEAGLSFLGFGDPTSVSWGQMLAFANANGALVQGFWVWLMVPGLALAVLITSLTFINFGVDLLSNPHLREG
jgi:peptide/nickel transport system permease protein